MWTVAAHPIMYTVLGISVGIIAITAPVVGVPPYNIYSYLLSPFVGSFVPAIYHEFAPYNPYKGPLGMADLDRRDADARRLRELFQSGRARVFRWRLAARLSGVLFLVMVCVTFVDRASLTWTFSLSALYISSLGVAAAAFVVYGAQYTTWGLETWLAESGRSVSGSPEA